MCRWMGSHFHDRIDFNGVALSRVTRMGSRIFLGFLELDNSTYLRLATVPECLYCR